jgi:hypothetical protein
VAFDLNKKGGQKRFVEVTALPNASFTNALRSGAEYFKKYSLAEKHIISVNEYRALGIKPLSDL